MKKKLFVTDLDGTALGGYEPYDRLPERFCAFLDQLSDQGWEWAVNTTWDPEGQWKVVCQSPVRSRPSFLIGEYGRSLVQVENGGRLAPVEPYSSIQKAALEDFCARKMFDLMRRAIAGSKPTKVFFYGHMLHIICQPGSPSETLQQLYEENKNDPEWIITLESNVFVARPAFLNKALPMQYIRDNLGYDPAKVVTAGDNIPDLDMMLPEYSAVPICPGNALDEVKKFVLRNGGAVGSLAYSDGVIEAFHALGGRLHEHCNA